VLHARRGTHDILEVGFATLRAHDLVAIDRCPVLAPGLNGSIAAAWAIAKFDFRGLGSGQQRSERSPP
jgi:23S rRNA (uracil1939-C5)-methyltransferase